MNLSEIFKGFNEGIGERKLTPTQEHPRLSGDCFDQRNLKCKADRTAVKRYILECILLSTIFRIDNTILHQEHKMLSEDGNKRLQNLINGTQCTQKR